MNDHDIDHDRLMQSSLRSFYSSEALILANTQASRFKLISAMLKTHPLSNTLAAEQAHPGQLGTRKKSSGATEDTD